MSFCHLHVHSEYSFLDGLARLEALVAQAADLNMSALALTDHGGMWGAVPFYKLCVKTGVKPILGCEVYVTGDHRSRQGGKPLHHLVLLAETSEGYENLLKLVTKSHLDGFYYRPRTDKALLAKYSSGLIALSGCIKGEVASLILREDLIGAKDAAEKYTKIFGRENFFLELQDHNLPQEDKVNPHLLDLSEALGIGVVATNDVHYITPEDAPHHKVLLSVQTLTDLGESLALPSDEYYLKSAREMQKLFSRIPEAIENTVKIAERCNVVLDFEGHHLPKIPVPQGFDDRGYLRMLTYEGARKIFGDPAPYEVTERIERELSVIEELGFCAYFLIVKDIVDYAKSRRIPVGVGRGSGAGSLICYCLGITGVNPLDYGLIFERFLNPERKNLPDIDVDLCHRGRKDVLGYIRDRFGHDQIAHVGAFSTLQARSVLRDTGRALGLSYDKVDRMCSHIPYSHISLEEAAAKIPPLAELLRKDKDAAKAFEAARHFQGLPRHMTQHSAGMVIAEKPLTHYVALQRASGEEIITQADMDILEDLGLVKIDLLGLRFLSAIGDTLDLAKIHCDIEMSDKDIPLGDDKTWDALGSGDTGGVFQLESSGMRSLLKKIRPKNIEDLSAVIALYRPGPLGSGETEEFIARRQGIKPVLCPHPCLEEVLRSTYGVFVYQEQLMQAACAAAGYTLGEADLLRRAISKSDPAQTDMLRSRFIRSASKSGVDEDTARGVFSVLSSFGGYAFNKSHSISYAITAYQTAYLKAHFPREYFAALLSLYMDAPSRLRLYITEARKQGLELLRPDINKSQWGFVPEGDNTLRTGFSLIKNLGTRGIETILDVRKGGDFSGFFNFCHRTSRRAVNVKALESLILAGAFDDYGLSRPAMLLSVKSAGNLNKNTIPGQLSLLPGEYPEETLAENVTLCEYTFEQKVSYELTSLGHYITAHPMELWEDTAAKVRTHTALDLADIYNKRPVTLVGMLMDSRWSKTRGGSRMMFLRLEDLTGDAEAVLFPRELSRFSQNLVTSCPLVIQGFADLKDDGERTVIVERIRPLH